MKIFLLFLQFFLTAKGVSDETESLTVIEGDSVTFHTGVTELKSEDSIVWFFKGNVLARLDKESNTAKISDENLKGRLKLNNQTGDLTLRKIKTTDSGSYKVTIFSGDKKTKIFNVIGISIESKKLVLVGESVTLHTAVPDIQKYDVIRWRFGLENSPIAEKIITVKLFDVLDERFKDRLQIDDLTGSLTITNIQDIHTGLYQVDIIKLKKYTIHKAFTVTITGEIEQVSVTEGEQLTLKSSLTKIQRDYLILWMFGDADIISLSSYSGNNNSIIFPFLDERFKDKLKLDETGSLIITKTIPEHAGLYKQTVISTSIHKIKKIMVAVKAGNSQIFNVVVAVLVAVVFMLACYFFIYLYRKYCKKPRLQLYRNPTLVISADETNFENNE